MGRKPLNILILLVFMLLISFSLWQHYHDKMSQQKNNESPNTNAADNIGTEKGQAAPDFSLTALDGKTVKLSDFRGQKVVLNFWATWCSPCREEMPDLQAFYSKNQDKNLTILAVNMTNQHETLDQVAQFADDYNLTFPIPLDEKNAVGQSYQIMTIPTSFLIDSKGIIHKKILGPVNQAMLSELINEME
ncbi:MAG: redoxin domain-containing protein [Bacillus sp. (in: firmicutes)]